MTLFTQQTTTGFVNYFFMKERFERFNGLKAFTLVLFNNVVLDKNKGMSTEHSVTVIRGLIHFFRITVILVGMSTCNYCNAVPIYIVANSPMRFTLDVGSMGSCNWDLQV